MHKSLKKVMSILTAGVLSIGALSIAACGTGFTPPTGGPSALDEAKDNGGFAVKKGEYIYFVNGVASYTSDNDYGTPVKGALMRVKESDVLAGKSDTAETVIPSLMVAADYTSGIYVYGDRIYYATPSTVVNTSGTILNDYLEFRSADLNGSDIVEYFNVSDNATIYRFIESGDHVYLLYVEDSNLISYNTSDGTEVTLAEGVGSYLLDSADKTNPYVYYTMPVTADLDIEDSGASARSYNQIYRVDVAATESPYEYKWDEKYLEDHEGEAPYVNLGEIVLDGIGASFKDYPTQLTHHLDGATPVPPAGYTYTLQSYTNGGIYFTRSEVAKTSSTGEDGWLYFLDEDKLTGSWNSISGNTTALEVVAQAQDTTNAGSAAIFYIEESGEFRHHYLYVSNSSIIRADVKSDGSVVRTRIAIGIGSATLSRIDASGSQYKYVYYTTSGSTGNYINRAVYNGDDDDYKTLQYEDNKPYRPVQVLQIEHARSWYPFELIDGVIYYADAETVGSSAYNYIAAVSLKGESGAPMNNVELDARNEAYNKIMNDEDFAEAFPDYSTNLRTAMRYYFRTGKTEQFYENIDEAKDKTGKENTLYSTDEVDQFKAFVEDDETLLRADFVTPIGKMTDADVESIDTYWTNALQHYTESASTAGTGLPGWAWALIGIAIGLVVIGAGAAAYLVVRKRKSDSAPKEPKMYVDTTDDKSVDVYSPEPEAAPAEVEEEPAESAEPAEVEEEPAESAEPAETEEEPAESAEPAESEGAEPAAEEAESPADEPDQPEE